VPLDLSILLASEPLVLSEIRMGPGEDGPAAHVHREHSDGFYVLEGELAVLLGSDWHRLGTGGAVLIPPGVVHTVRNASSASVRMLNLHAPGAGFDDYVRAGREGDRAARERFDQHPPPEDGGRPGTDATLVQGELAAR
jgi:mannose-6-phosphate isomerase-like protein (cupin superfamily)